ncbi:MAG: hypothetical protein IPL39_10725 [Opitutaceae bacterium]|nr:hypothetical protein [Opitutaceae bacterium]
MPFLITFVIGFIGTFIATPIVLALGRVFQLWGVLPERSVLVYTLFGKVIGRVEELAVLPDRAFRAAGAAAAVLRQGLPGEDTSSSRICATNSSIRRRARR